VMMMVLVAGSFALYVASRRNAVAAAPTRTESPNERLDSEPRPAAN
jgi:hypothetical protein